MCQSNRGVVCSVCTGNPADRYPYDECSSCNKWPHQERATVRPSINHALNIEYRVTDRCSCVACGVVFDERAILFDKHIRAVFHTPVMSAYGLCPKCLEKLGADKVLVIELSPSETVSIAGGCRMTFPRKVVEAVSKQVVSSPVVLADKAAFDACIREDLKKPSQEKQEDTPHA